MLMVPTKRSTGPLWVQLLGAWAVLHLLCALLYAPMALRYSGFWLITYGFAYKLTGGNQTDGTDIDQAEESSVL